MPSTLEIRRRIRSVQSTRKITHAMELVAAAKMRRAQAQTRATRTYAKLAWDILTTVSRNTDTASHPLLRQNTAAGKGEKGIGKIAVIQIFSNRGLAGAFNAQLIQALRAFFADRGYSPEIVDIINLGKKGQAISKFGYSLVADFEKPDIVKESIWLRSVATMVIGDFIRQKYSHVYLAYTDFVSTLRQTPVVRQILPILPEEIRQSIGSTASESLHPEQSDVPFEYVFEPNSREVLDQILPRFLELQVYQALLESLASEHSARMVAMKNATEAAGDLLDELTIEMNQLRQSAITKELAEISSAITALR